MLLLGLTVISAYLPRRVKSPFSTFLDYDLSVLFSALSHPALLTTQHIIFTYHLPLLNGLKKTASRWSKWNKSVQDLGEIRVMMTRLSRM